MLTILVAFPIYMYIIAGRCISSLSLVKTIKGTTRSYLKSKLPLFVHFSEYLSLGYEAGLLCNH